MTSNERRLELIDKIKSVSKPLKGSELAKDLNVSRQVIVQDIAILRARGIDIIATSQGYIMHHDNLIVETIECKNHNSVEDVYEELKVIVDMGAKIKDVIVEHPMYGQIRAELNINSVRDIKKFIENIENGEFKQLSILSNYKHRHTIEAEDIEIIEDIKKELKSKDILF